MIKFLTEVVHSITGIIVIFIGLIIVSIFAFFIAPKLWENKTFANNYFSAEVNVEKVIASKRWFFTEVFACTFAIIKYDDSTAKKIAKHGPQSISIITTVENRTHPWPKNWLPTPLAKANLQQCGDSVIPIPCCLKNIPPKYSKIIKSEIYQSGSWFHKDSEHTEFILPKSRLMGTIRYGD